MRFVAIKMAEQQAGQALHRVRSRQVGARTALVNVQAEVDLPMVKRISGHKTLQMVERYSHQNGDHIQAAMDRLQSRYQTGKKQA